MEAGKCPVREISIDNGQVEHFYPSFEELLAHLPRKYAPNKAWKARELEKIEREEVRLKKRRKEVESLK